MQIFEAYFYEGALILMPMLGQEQPFMIDSDEEGIPEMF